MKPFPPIRIDEAGAAHRQITSQLRELILSGQLKIGTKLPGIRELAQSIGINYFTVQEALTPLERDGLIERRPRHGTVVLRNTPALTTVGVYFGANILRSGSGFYPFLYDILFTKLEAEGTQVRLFIDNRRHAQQAGPCPYLQKAIQNYEIQGVIAVMLMPEHLEWLPNLPVPVSLLTSVHMPKSVKGNDQQFVRESLRHLATRGCKTVGMIPNPWFHSKEYQMICKEEAAAAGVHIIEGKERTALDFYPTPVEYGYRSFMNRWQTEEKPDGLLVYPDSYVPGVLTAILELRLSIPQDLKLLFYRNREIPLHCTVPVDWSVISISAFADSMIQQLKEQLTGKTSGEISLPAEITCGY